MPSKGLRVSKSGDELRRQSTLEPPFLSPFDFDDVPFRGTMSSDFSSHERTFVENDDTLSHRGTRLEPALFEDHTSNGIGEDDMPMSSRQSQDSAWHPRHYSFYKWRHASDSHLAAKARAQSQRKGMPPVPALPHEPPLIVTTGPVQEETTTPEKRKSRFTMLSRTRTRSRSPAPQLVGPKDEKVEKTRSGDKRRTIFGGRQHLQVQGAAQDTGPTRNGRSLDLNSLTNPSRLSESSTLLTPQFDTPRNSDAQSVSPSHIANDHLTNQPVQRPLASHTKTWLPHRKKNRQSLFPLPIQIQLPSHVLTAPSTPRASTSGISSSSPTRSLGEHSPALGSPQQSGFDESAEHPPTEHQIHRTQADLSQASSLGFVAAAPSLSRTLSTSGRSDRSAPARGAKGTMPFPLRRGRSVTLGSKDGIEGRPMAPPTPPTLSGSGRTSTSTAGRSSFSNLLNLGHKFRHGSDPHYFRQGSPGLNSIGSGLASHTNSFSISREALRVTLPERQEGESAGKYLERVEECVDKSQVPAVLSKETDEFYVAVMRSAMRKFTFFGDPLDMSIRKLLMEVDLPKETQQIDRFLQSFADRYHECNPGIFISADKAYFVAFSLLILQTDAFNKNNKRKMNKPDYLKNSCTDGVSEDVLSCFYDNIVYTPFIRVEDEADSKTYKRKPRKTISKPGAVESLKNARQDPIDPYELIMHNKLDTLRPHLKEGINLEDPYSYANTAVAGDVKGVHRYSKAGILQIESQRSRPDAFLSPTTIENPEQARPGLIDLPVDKIGILWRKDPKKKAARSPWQEWGAILTGSGLSFFKNAGWVKNLMHQQKHHSKHHGAGSVIFRPPIQVFKPDYLLPTENAVALYDRAYKRHKNAFVFFSQSGVEEVFLADDESELGDWLIRLNHQASYRTAGIRPRGLVGGNYEGQRHRALRRLESTTSTQTVQTPTGEVTIQSGNIDSLLAQQISAARREAMAVKIEELEELLGAKIKELDHQLRDLRHLLVLAPIQQKSREQLVHAAGRISAKLKWTRIEIWRMKCHRDILALDLDDENTTAGIANKSPKLASTQLSPVPSNTQSTDQLARVGGTLHLSNNIPIEQHNELHPGLDGTLQQAQTRPLTNHTMSSNGTAPSEDDNFRTPPETTPQGSPAFAPTTFSGLLAPERTASRDSSATALSPTDVTARRLSSTSSRRSRPLSQVSNASGYTTPLGESDVKGRRASWAVLATVEGRPNTASGSDTELNKHAGTPESKRGSQRILARTLRDSQRSSGHRRSKAGHDSGSSATIAESVIGTLPEAEKLSRTPGSFTLHGKKASVVTFGSEWVDMLPEQRLKLRREAQEREVQSAIEDDGNATLDAHALRHTLRSASEASVRSSPAAVVAGLGRDAGSTASPNDRPLTAVEREKRADRKVSSPSVLGAGVALAANGVGVAKPAAAVEGGGAPAGVERHDYA